MASGRYPSGRRSEGLFFAGPALIQKSISGLGYIVKGSILTAVGFSTATTDAEKVAAEKAKAEKVAELRLVEARAVAEQASVERSAAERVSAEKRAAEAQAAQDYASDVLYCALDYPHGSCERDECLDDAAERYGDAMEAIQAWYEAETLAAILMQNMEAVNCTVAPRWDDDIFWEDDLFWEE